MAMSNSLAEIGHKSRAAGSAASARSRRRAWGVLAHPADTDRSYTPEEQEFLFTLRAWQDRTGVRFPTACDYLRLLISLGYRRPSA